ncbi:MAG: hypothetical protein LHV68_03885 [Elusimicrobia bacterium]|nr:hypothetical protein [Candidatus Liberimonas magnetica]
MRYLCMILGFITGKWSVKCRECKNLDAENECYGHLMPAEIIDKNISCGFWSKK